MTPIEAMAKAAYDDHLEFSVRVNKMRKDGLIFEVFHHEERNVVSPVVVTAHATQQDAEQDAFDRTNRAAMRAALLALADCEIPADIPARAWSMHETNIPEGVVVDVNAMMVAEFRAMLRSIATGG